MRRASIRRIFLNRYNMYLNFDVPDIIDFPSGFPAYWMKRVFINSVSANFQINVLTTTYIRLVETALYDYRQG